MNKLDHSYTERNLEDVTISNFKSNADQNYYELVS